MDDVVIVGSGWAGSAAAYELSQRGFRCRVLEREPDPGGRADSEQLAGATVQLGTVWLPHMASRLRAYIDRFELTDDLVVVPPLTMRIKTRSGWHVIDPGDAGSLLHGLVFTRVFSPRLRALLPSALRARHGLAATYRDIADIDELGALDHLSLASAFRDPDGVLPAFTEFNTGYRAEDAGLSFLAGFMGRLLGAGIGGQPTLSRLIGGTRRLIDRLLQDSELECSVSVSEVVRADECVIVRASTDAGPSEYRARAVLLATPADVAQRVWTEVPPAVENFLNRVRYAGCEFLYLRTDVRHDLRTPDGRAMIEEIVPSRRRSADCSFGVCSLNDWVDDGGLLLAGEAPTPFRPADPEQDRRSAGRLQAELESLHPSLRGHIVARRFFHRNRYVPVFDPGYVGVLRSVRRHLVPGPIDVAGDYLRAPHSEGALASGIDAAERIAAHLRDAVARPPAEPIAR